MKILYYLYQPYKWLVFIPFFGVMTIILSTLSIITTILISQKTGRIWAVIWGKIMCFAAPVKVFVKGKENIAKKKSYLIIANHQTLWDILLIYGFLNIDFRFLMKKELRKAPFLGYCCEKAGHIYVDRKSPKAALQSLNEAKQKISNGTSVLIFPEGSRSKEKEMKQFKKGAFKLATEMELDILPVTVVDSYKILRKGFLNLVPGKTGLIIHQPVIIKNYNDDMEKLMNDAREILNNY